MYKKHADDGNPIIKELIFPDIDEPMVGIQLFGSEPELFGLVVKQIHELFPNYKFIVLNLGCPSRSVTSIGAGASLLKKPEKVQKILDVMTKFSPLPVTIKTRLGWSEFSLPNILKIVQDYDIEFVTVHLRYAIENYNTPAHKELIRDITNISDVLIIANGDIFSKEDEEYYFSQGVAGVAIGRWAKNNLRVFSNSDQPTIEEKKKTFEEFLYLYKKMVSKTTLPTNLTFIKKFTINLIKGSYGSKKIKLLIQRTKTLQELRTIFSEHHLIAA